MTDTKREQCLAILQSIINDIHAMMVHGELSEAAKSELIVAEAACVRVIDSLRARP